MNQELSRVVTWQDPRPAAQQAQHLSGLDYLSAIVRGDLPPPPIARLMDFEFVTVAAGEVTLAVTPAAYHYNPIGSVHGGLAATLLDSAMACAIHSALPAGVAYTTLELSVNYVRAITLESGRLRCEGRVIHLGRRVATAEGRLVDESGRLYAHGKTTCLVIQGGAKHPP